MSLLDTRQHEILEDLKNMGIREGYARRAIKVVDCTLKNATELIFHWMEENPDDPKLDEPDNTTATGVELKVDPVDALVDMGFKRDAALRALKASKNDVSTALVSLLSEQAESLTKSINEQQAELDRITPSGTEETPLPADHDDDFTEPSKKLDASKAQAAIQGSNPSAATEEIKKLTAHIVQLQELVITYQQKYLDLKRKTRQEQRKRRQKEDGPPGLAYD